MKTIEKMQKIEYIIYYIYIFLLCCFIGISGFLLSVSNIIIPILSFSAAIVSLIILRNLYKNIKFSVYLLPWFIVLLFCLLLGITIIEVINYPINIYMFIIKLSLYVFCVLTPFKHFCQITRKLKY